MSSATRGRRASRSRTTWNWFYAHQGARGTIARRYPFNYEMGLGRERKSWPVEWLGGNVHATEDVSEQNQRGFYRRWAELMES